MNTILPLGQKALDAATFFRAFSVDNSYVIAKQVNSSVDNFELSYLKFGSPEAFEAAWADLASLTGFSLTSVADLKVNVADILYKQSTLTEVY